MSLNDILELDYEDIKNCKFIKSLPSQIVSEIEIEEQYFQIKLTSL